MLHTHVDAIRQESRHRRLSSLSLFIFFVALIQTDIDAQWSTDPRLNTAITTAVRNQTEVKIATDGSGGAFIVWSENNFPDRSSNIFAQRVNAHGKPTWGAPSVTVCGAVGDQITPQIIGDGRGASIIAWQDMRSGNFDIYAQHLNQSGSRDWAFDGIPICTEAQTQSSVQLASDGAGGAFIAWLDARLSGPVIYAQHLSASGVSLWTSNGIPVSDPRHSATPPLITADMEGGAFIVWGDRHDTVSGDEFYAQHVSASGELSWPQPGLPVCTGLPGWREIESIAPDGYNGFLISWMDTRSSTMPDVYAQRIKLGGEAVWTPNGLVIGAAHSIQRFSHLMDDGSGGAFITWSDARDETARGWDVYLQHVMSSGEIAWRTNGIPLTNESNTQDFSSLVSDGDGGVIIAWKDSRSGVDIYAQRVNANGQPLWAPGGVAVSTAPGIQEAPEIVSTGIGGAIMAWVDHRASVGTDIYAQNVDPGGRLGYPPVLTKVADVPEDQGGRVLLLWECSALETKSLTFITQYNLYRGVAQSMFAAPPRLASEAAPTHASPPYITNGMHTPAGEPIYWELIATTPSAYHMHYSCAVQTLSDSGPHGNAQYYYMVRAYYGPTIFWDSEPETGASVDNLPPLMTEAPTAHVNADGSVALHWTPNRHDSDIACYHVYHSSTPDFTPDTSSLAGSCIDTSFIDASPPPASTVYYCVAAEDLHGNLGEASARIQLERVVTHTATESGARPFTFELEQNYPNPFNPSTVIGYTLSVGSHVRLTLYRSTGAEAATLFDGFQEAGHHELPFDASAFASGMYFYRLQAGAFTAARKMVVVH